MGVGLYARDPDSSVAVSFFGPSLLLLLPLPSSSLSPSAYA